MTFNSLFTYICYQLPAQASPRSTPQKEQKSGKSTASKQEQPKEVGASENRHNNVQVIMLFTNQT